MPELSAEEAAALVQRQSQEDLKNIVLGLQRDGSFSGDFVDPIASEEDADAKAAAEEARDVVLANAFVVPPSAAPSEEELAGNAQASVDAGESEEAAAPKSAKKEAAAQGA